MRDGKPLTERKLAVSKALRFIKSTNVEKLLKEYHVIESLLLQEMAKIGQPLLFVCFVQTNRLGCTEIRHVRPNARILQRMRLLHFYRRKKLPDELLDEIGRELLGGARTGEALDKKIALLHAKVTMKGMGN